MGAVNAPKTTFLERLGAEFDFTAPSEPGLDSISAIQAIHEGKAQVFLGLGGNFAAACPDTEYTRQALRRCRLTVQIATRLNRSHLATGREALLLPCLARSERDHQESGDQFVSVENAFGVVHRSQGRRNPASAALRSETAIVAAMARATLGDATRVPWEELVKNYEKIRTRVARVVPGFEQLAERIREPGGLVRENRARNREFANPARRTRFRSTPLPEMELREATLLLMTVRSHDQFNTTVYGNDDRYRGVAGRRRVVLLNRADMDGLGIADDQLLELTSHCQGRTRSVEGFSAMAYDVPQGCAVGYFPELNPLIPLEHRSAAGTPACKSIPIRVAPMVQPTGA